MIIRAEDRNFHFTYRVTCTNTKRIFFGVHSSDSLTDGFKGAGSALYESKKDHGIDNHKYEILKLFDTRKEAKTAYSDLKASELINPRRPEEYVFHYVYKIVRFDGAYYIGVHSTNNLNDKYLGSGTKIISRSVKKHGRDKHTRKILEMCESREAAFEREKELLGTQWIDDALCMNLTDGGKAHGNRVYGFSEESRARISEHFKTVVRTPEWCTNISKATKGRKQPPEAVQKQRAALTGLKCSREDVAKRIAGQLASEKFKKRYRPIIVDGATYQNGREASAALGIPGSTLNYRIKSDNWINYRWLDSSEKSLLEVSPRARGPYSRHV